MFGVSVQFEFQRLRLELTVFQFSLDLKKRLRRCDVLSLLLVESLDPLISRLFLCDQRLILCAFLLFKLFAQQVKLPFK